MLELLLSWDVKTFLFLNRTIANTLFDAVFPVITNGDFWILPGITVIYFFIRKEKKTALVAIALVAVAIALTDSIAYRILKPWVGRLRPCHPDMLVEGARYIVGLRRSYSFPSNHAANMFGAATVLAFFYPKRRIWLYLFASLIAFSRIYIGVHYPLDILGGAVFGGIVGLAVFGGYTGTKKTIFSNSADKKLCGQ